jgi:hypothetical protein
MSTKPQVAAAGKDVGLRSITSSPFHAEENTAQKISRFFVVLIT